MEEEEVGEMSKDFNNYAPSVSYLGTRWVGRDSEFPDEPAASAVSNPRLESRRCGYQTIYEVRPEVSEVVEDSVSILRAKQLMKSLESDLQVMDEELSTEWGIMVNFSPEWWSIDGTDISAQRIQPQEPPGGQPSSVCVFTFTTGESGAWIAERLLSAQPEEDVVLGATIEAEVGLEYASDKVIEQVEAWGLKGQVDKAFEIAKEMYRTLCGVCISISEDPEITDSKRVLLAFRVSGTPQEVFENELSFKEKLHSITDEKDCERITIAYEWE